MNNQDDERGEEELRNIQRYLATPAGPATEALLARGRDFERYPQIIPGKYSPIDRYSTIAGRAILAEMFVRW
jgi:hypothetical protein